MRSMDKDEDGLINREEFMSYFLNRFRKNHESGRPMFLRRMISRTGIKGGVQDIELVDRILFGIQQVNTDDLEENRYADERIFILVGSVLVKYNVK